MREYSRNWKVPHSPSNALARAAKVDLLFIEIVSWPAIPIPSYAISNFVNLSLRKEMETESMKEGKTFALQATKSRMLAVMLKVSNQDVRAKYFWYN